MTTRARPGQAAVDVPAGDPADTFNEAAATGPVTLTRMELNRARPGTHRLLASPQSLHAAVACALPPRGAARTIHDPFAALDPDNNTIPSRTTPPAGGRDPHGHGARLLWRVDHDGPYTTLYLLSPGEPDLTHLVQQAGWPNNSEPGWQSRSYTPLLAGLRHRQRWGFRLIANTTRTERHGREQTRRIGLTEPTDQAHWLLQRAPTLGFTLTNSNRSGSTVNLIVTDPQNLRFHRRNTAVTLTTACFEGTLEVHDPTRFRRTLIDGIGHGRAYGCGLLTLTPTT